MSVEGVNLGACKVLAATEKALKVQLEVEDAPRWVPKSQIHDDSEVFDANHNDEGDLVVTQWFAEKEGLSG